MNAAVAGATQPARAGRLVATVGELLDALADVDPTAPLEAFLWQPEACCPDGFWDGGTERHDHDVPEVMARSIEVDTLGAAGVVLLRLDPT